MSVKFKSRQEATPAAPIPAKERQAVRADKRDEEATPRGRARHRMGGSTSDGMYITNHHRGAKKR